MAAQCLIQAIGGEGYVYIKGYGDLKFYEAFVLDSEEKLDTSRSLERLNSYEEIDSTDRVFLFAPFYTEEVEKDVQRLIDLDVDFVLVCNNPKRDDFPEHLMHYVNLSHLDLLFILKITIKLFNLIQWHSITYIMKSIRK